MRSIDTFTHRGATCTRLKTGPRSTWQNQCLLLLCQTRLITCIQMCSGATWSHLHPSHGRDPPGRVHYFTYLSISTHRQTARASSAKPHNTCHLIAVPQRSGLHLAPCPTALRTIKNEASCASIQYVRLHC